MPTTVEAAGFCTHLPNMPTRKSGFVAWQQCNQEFKTKTEVAFSHRQPQVLWNAGDTVANCMALESEGVFNNRLNCLDVHGLTGPFRLSFLRLPASWITEHRLSGGWSFGASLSIAHLVWWEQFHERKTKLFHRTSWWLLASYRCKCRNVWKQAQHVLGSLWTEAST